jgi:predicted Fe-Mo cluster-binding NifX family protein
MSKIGVMMSADRADAQMSSHFGKAEWIMVTNTDNPVPAFIKNVGQKGKSAVEIVLSQGCTDVILADIGDGALGHLQAAHIRAWAVPTLVAGDKALDMFRNGQLPAVPSARSAMREGAGGRHSGCCCSNRGGAETSSCCQG